MRDKNTVTKRNDSDETTLNDGRLDDVLTSHKLWPFI